MLSAGILRSSCLRCRQDLLRLFGGAIASPLLISTRASRRSAAASSLSRTRNNLAPSRHRCFSSTSATRQSPNPSPADPPPKGERPMEDVEEFVRQAKATFGDTLPPDYLSPEEYVVYERLFGPPLRETRPEDVGISFPELAEDSSEDAGPFLLRETEDGGWEVVEGHAPVGISRGELIPEQDLSPDVPADIQEVEVSGERALPEEPSETSQEEPPEDLDEDVDPVYPHDPRLDYLSITPKNKREFKALMKLQADFEQASLLAMAQAERRVVEEALEMARAVEAEVRQELDGKEELESENGRVIEEETFHDEKMEQWVAQDDGPRLHPLTVEGQFNTQPRTIQLPKDSIVDPISAMLSRTDPVHLRDAAEEAFGGPGLPFSARTPAHMLNAKQVGIALEAGHQRMSQIRADVYMSTVFPSVYASVTSILVEVRKRLGSSWLRGLMAKNEGGGPRVLDAGGAGAGLLAWQHVVDAEWQAMRAACHPGGSGREPPAGKKTAIVGSDFLRYRVAGLLDNTTYLPYLRDYLHSAKNAEKQLDAPADPLPRKVYDVIIMGHMLMPLDRSHKRKQLVDNIWEQLNPDGGLLIVLEKGHPRGFEAVADVRSRLLKEFIIPPPNTSAAAAAETVEPSVDLDTGRTKEPGMIVAPCTNHQRCPMYTVPGYTHGRKDFCHFSQRFIRPPFYQHILGATHENHEDVNFSYVAIQRGPTHDHAAPGGPWQGKEATDRAFAGYGQHEAQPDSQPTNPPSMLSLPRNILPPIKGRGHVILDMCTPAGAIERWTVPKSFGKQAYHDARKARWGDLWALGAKTRLSRRVRLGVAEARAAAARAAATAEEGPEGTAAVSEDALSPSVLAANVMYPLGPPKGKAGDGGVRARAAEAARERGRKPRVVDVWADKSSGQIENVVERGSAGKRPQVERRAKKGGEGAIADLLRQMDHDGVDPEEEEDDADDPDFARFMKQTGAGGGGGEQEGPGKRRPRRGRRGNRGASEA